MGSDARVYTRQTFGVRLMSPISNDGMDKWLQDAYPEEVTFPFNGDELYEIIKLYDILRDMDFELTETQVEVFERLQDAEVNGGFF